jgi:hypothetical protein
MLNLNRVSRSQPEFSRNFTCDRKNVVILPIRKPSIAAKPWCPRQREEAIDKTPHEASTPDAAIEVRRQPISVTKLTQWVS